MEPEKVLQYWDDLDDLIGAIGLFAENLRRLAIFTLGTMLFLFVLIGGMAAAVTKPPLALAIVIILLMTLLYRSVTQPMHVRAAPGVEIGA